MEAITRNELEEALKDSALSVLNELVKHHVKGAELIQQGLKDLASIQPQLNNWYEILKSLLIMLKPLFDIARDWLVKCYKHLVAIFDWAKEMYKKIFG
jgi:hypothetical protein